MNSSEVDALLDVREVDGAPFEKVMDALGRLCDGDRLRLVAPFEPEPLCDVLDERGFVHETSRDGEVYRADIAHTCAGRRPRPPQFADIPPSTRWTSPVT